MNTALKILLAASALSLLGCGTVNTVMREDHVAVQALKKQKTYCQSISRVYSGVAYDLCQLHAPPSATTGVWVNFVPLIFIDVVASGVLDTLVLPYTVYRQSTDGSIELR
ncbi:MULTISPECIES: YceK/YidQ family lipoprotein [Pseudomonas]|uniref:YceK/YidQ family lipoprotein n=1 Tax=Pseudomonas TaxID=286 RepID=UPI001AE7ABF5|nr:MULTISPECIES: YceK/YidQ family lipoprotein [unclassified Pseudomonas]MBP1127417.1 uncharacterized protein YceK [Pseudomonas sp. PvP025]MDQ0401277.1 uncharacterized protein YceK [Pseudomonas sp. PvP006]